MRERFLAALFLLAALPTFSQQTTADPAVATLPQDPRAFFETAVPHYDFSDVKLKPWHLRATYQLYDFEGKPTLQGTWEYWWVSPKVRVRSWTHPGATQTDWITQDGTILRKRSGESLHYFERRLEDIILYPGPNYEMIDSGKLKLGLGVVGEGSSSLTCLTATRQQEVDGKLQTSSHATPDDYCFDPKTMALLTTYSNNCLSRYSQFVKMQNHYIARHISVQLDQQTRLTVSVETIDGIDEADPGLAPAADAVPTWQRAHYTSDGPQPETVTEGKPVKKVPPVYPAMSRSQHELGLVKLAGTIGTDGKVRNLEVLASPSELLAESAIDAVRQWTYEPFTVHGVPIEIDTTLGVNFSAGP
jgi:TonB family protein